MVNPITYNNVSRWTRTLLLLAVAVVAIAFSFICLIRVRNSSTESKPVSLSLFAQMPSALQQREPKPVATSYTRLPAAPQPIVQPEIESSVPVAPSVLYEDSVLTVNRGDCPPGEERRFPDAIIIGIRKAGTKAILDYVDLHSQIKVPEQDEIHYFDMNNNYYLGK